MAGTLEDRVYADGVEPTIIEDFIKIKPINGHFNIPVRSGIKRGSDPLNIILHEIPYKPGLLPSTVRNVWETGNIQFIGHFIIGTDGTIINAVPDDEFCFHTEVKPNIKNNYKIHDYNIDSISIFLICESPDGNLSKRELESLQSLLRYLTSKWNISNVITTYDATGVAEPRFFVEKRNEITY